MGNLTLGLKYRAYFTGTDDDIGYILHYRYPGTAVSDLRTLSVLAYNIYMRPVLINGQGHRTRLLPHELRGYDVIVFSEAFDNVLRKQLRTARS